ncbi:hypothetical protein GALMADRAFT_236075 [Galerina marginata CBS 339.88]|uniref:Uncharacterized protein n=1 Tax=Galerina marginata (strain CBS 339.88) TaxID=685588 RepID=A0A067TN14_GALM3|nr:hypothetical protein GALMADRAFT_236075 [Galerina marginata CBS 339.88]
MPITAISSCDCVIIWPSILWCIMIMNKSAEMDKIAIEVWVSWKASDKNLVITRRRDS